MIVEVRRRPAEAHELRLLEDSYKLQGLRQKLVAEVTRKGVHNRAVLAALGRVPRHFFVESAFAERIYEDSAFPIANGQTISQPYTVALQTELIEPQPGLKVLEIGTGSGYQAAILCELGLKVYSIERDAELKHQAVELLRRMGYKPEVLLGDGTQGWPKHAPYDAILVTAGSPTVPQALMDQLAVGGKLVIPVGDRNQQEMRVVERTGPSATEFRETVHGLFRFVPLVGVQGWQLR